VLLEHFALKIIEIAETLNVSTRTIDQIKKKLRNNKEDLEAKRAGKFGRKCNTTSRLDGRIGKMSLSNRRSLCRKFHLHYSCSKIQTT